jgi:hypothetical protein
MTTVSHEPYDVDELIVNKKKINEVIFWILYLLFSFRFERGSVTRSIEMTKTSVYWLQDLLVIFCEFILNLN